MRVVNLPRKAGDAPLLEEFEVRLDEPLCLVEGPWRGDLKR